MPNIKENKHEKNENKCVFHSLDSSSNSESETSPEVVVFSEEYDQDNVAYKGLSDIRKYNTPLLNEQSHKYRGEVTSRESDICYDHSSIPSVSYSEIDLEHQCADTNVDYPDESVLNKVAKAKYKNLILNSHSNLEVQKAICVQNQLTIWEKLLETRINFQKMLNKANNLPYSQKCERLASYKEYAMSAQETKKNLVGLLEKLVETKFTLSMQHSEIKKLNIKKFRQNDSKKEYNLLNKSNFEKFKPYRNAILLKWEDRTKLLSSHNANKTKNSAEKLTVIKNIDNHLTRLNELIEQTRIIKTSSRPSEKQVTDALNENTQEISHVEIYDDTDFYHSQLRELIEYKTNASANSYEINKQFSELQKLRQKMKKKVDTRASKGRKIRYIVHNKLINFMGSKSSSNWSEESKSELYKSLFLT